MNTSLSVLMVLLLGFLSGCAAPPLAHVDCRDDQAISAIKELNDMVRYARFTNDIGEYALIADSNIVAACQTLLLRYSTSDRDAVRLAAAYCLAHFGTMPALQRALEVAHDEPSPEARAQLWCVIAVLLRESVARSALVIHGDPGDPYEYRAWDLVLPPDFDAAMIEREIVAEFERDEGSWTVEGVDRIPFVPFSGRRYTFTRTVREVLADELGRSAMGHTNLLAAFKILSTNADEKVSRPAQYVVEALTAVPVSLRLGPTP